MSGILDTTALPGIYCGQHQWCDSDTIPWDAGGCTETLGTCGSSRVRQRFAWGPGDLHPLGWNGCWLIRGFLWYCWWFRNPISFTCWGWWFIQVYPCLSHYLLCLICSRWCRMCSINSGDKIWLNRAVAASWRLLHCMSAASCKLEAFLLMICCGWGFRQT